MFSFRRRSFLLFCIGGGGGARRHLLGLVLLEAWSFLQGRLLVGLVLPIITFVLRVRVLVVS